MVKVQWTDGKRYKAVVIKPYLNGDYEVRFTDGTTERVKGEQIEGNIESFRGKWRINYTQERSGYIFRGPQNEERIRTSAYIQFMIEDLDSDY